MKNRKGQPICGKTVEGPIVKDRGRSRPLWRSNCRRVVKAESDYCWQHKPATESEESR